jgi:hydroxymethylpyrimidine pyrophosphatase-like HAD family hydrolase
LISEAPSLDRYVPTTMESMRHRVLACDFDGTLAVEGVYSDDTIRALERVADAGIRLVLVTGRTAEELADVFDPGTLFERIVVENGAVVIDAATGQELLLGPRIPGALVAEFQRTGVNPLIVGRVLCSTDWSQAAKLSAAIAKLGVDRQVVRNRESAMVLPPGINKRTGLEAALRSMGELPAATVAVGDGENDIPLFAVAGVSVAVANAVDALKARADVVMTEPDGRGVQSLAAALVAGDLGALTALSPLAG